MENCPPLEDLFIMDVCWITYLIREAFILGHSMSQWEQLFLCLLYELHIRKLDTII